jgi:dUTPase
MIYAPILTTKSLHYPPGKRLKVGTGIRLELLEQWEANITLRFGVATNYGVIVLNSPVIID